MKVYPLLNQTPGHEGVLGIGCIAPSILELKLFLLSSGDI